MRPFKKFGTLAAAVLALSAIGATSASAATFTASATGSMAGKALGNQVFTFNGGTASCTTAAASGTIAKTADTQKHLTVNYSGCTAFGFATVHYSNLTFLFTSNGKVHIKNTGTITPTLFGTSLCTETITPQTASGVLHANSGLNNLKIDFEVSGIVYHSTGGSCGASGENGTYTGDLELNGTAGQILRFDP